MFTPSRNLWTFDIYYLKVKARRVIHVSISKALLFQSFQSFIIIIIAIFLS